MGSAKDIKFAVEGTLGGLAKWLRVLGFDTRYERNAKLENYIWNMGKDRVFLTRTAAVLRKGSGRVVFVRPNDPGDQLRAVVGQFGITRNDIRLFSRCVRCNRPVAPAERETVRGKVPDYIWERHDTFRICLPCDKIYWAGSHIRRSMEKIEKLF